jgi:hypothetical protein
MHKAQQNNPPNSHSVTDLENPKLQFAALVIGQEQAARKKMK